MMHCRTPEHFWSQFARPFIFVPASFLNDHDGNLGEDEKSRISEILPDTDALHASSSTMSTFPSNLPYLTSDMPTGDNLLVPSAEKSTVRGRLRRARLADGKGVRRAEDIPEYKGQMSIDDLVEFINNSGRTTSRKDSTKSRATTRSNIARNDSKRRPREFGETGSTDEIIGSKVTEEIDVDVEKRNEKEQKIDSVGNMGVVDQEDAVDLDSGTGIDVAWNDFTVVSRRRKGKTRFDRETSPNDVNLTIEAEERAELNRGNTCSSNEINFTSGAKGMLKEKDISKEANLTSDAKGRPKGEDSPKEANLTSQVNQSCPQVERIRQLNGDKQSKALRSENRSPDSVRNAHNPTAQDLTNTPSREGTVTLGRVDKVNPALNEAYLSSQNGSSISSQKPSQHSENKSKNRSTHQTTGGHDRESEVSPESGTQRLSTKEIASIENSETKRPPSKSGYLCPPVVFTDRNRTNFKELVDISFGFDVQDSESGFELGNYIDSAMKDCSSGSNDCRCSQADVKGGQTDKNINDIKSKSVLPTNNGSDKNNNACEVTKNATLQSGNGGDPEGKKKMVPPSATLLMDTTTSHQISTSRNGKVEKHCGDSTKAEKRTTTGALQNTSSAKENQDRISSDKIEAQRVNCTALSKKNSTTVPVKTESVTNSLSIEVSADPIAATATSLSSTGRPISIVAPNQMSRLLFSSGQSSCSGYGSLGSSGHSESSSSVKSDCSSQSFCSSLVHCSHSSSCHGVSSTILGPCARAPVVKVAPMLVEKLISNEAIDATTECKSSSYCEESALEDDHRAEDECIHESSLLLTRACDVTKRKSANPYENDHTVQRHELFSGKIDHDAHNEELLLRKVDCDSVEQAAPHPHGTTNFPATLSNTTGAEVPHGKHFNPPGNVFHLLSAQIYLYKSYLDSRSDLHEVYEEVPETNQHQDPLE